MLKRSRKPADFNQMGFGIIREATDPDHDPYRGKNPAAVELGRLGGKKGGKARASQAHGPAAVRDLQEGGSGQVEEGQPELIS